jgi:hypothetical protein
VRVVDGPVVSSKKLLRRRVVSSSLFSFLFKSRRVSVVFLALGNGARRSSQRALEEGGLASSKLSAIHGDAAQCSGGACGRGSHHFPLYALGIQVTDVET